jgi:hypothetical protein
VEGHEVRNPGDALPVLARGTRLVLASLGALVLTSASAGTAHAKPPAPGIVCNTYPELDACVGAVPACTLCHTSTDPPAWNPFGLEVRSKLPVGPPFEDGLPDALKAVEGLDADGDGVANLDELRAGSRPGEVEAPSFVDARGARNPSYRVDGYDPAFAYRRMSVLYCGRSPTFDEMKAFRAAGDEKAQKRKLQEELGKCLDSDYWSRTALARLADKRVRPLSAAGADSTIKIASFKLVIGDYQYDYRLWRYVLTGDRDMRELLTADYFVKEDDAGNLVTTYDVITKPDPGALAGGQPLPRELRAGMISTQWFLTINTMFSPLPRTTAAQAYRSYLDADISNQEGLRPVAGEPVDVDKKGVGAERCANCHSTLDPLAYAFVKYEGIQYSADLRFGDYRPERAKEMIPDWDDGKEQPVLFGQKVSSLVEWAKVASESDAFKRNMADLFFRQALGRAPGPDDQDEFVALVESIAKDGYSANRLIARLIDTNAFGSP